jgi:Asp/Glu/hydantoin racemase
MISVVTVGLLMCEYPPAERQRREELVKQYETDNLRIEIVTVPLLLLGDRGDPGDVPSLGEESFVRAAAQAEAMGCDAVVPFGTLDIGVQRARAIINIPIVGAFESALRTALYVGDRIGLVTYTDDVTYHSILLRAYGMEHAVIGRRAAGIHLADYAAEHRRLRSAFLASSQELIDEGADVIISAGVSMCPLWLEARDLSDTLGVPVVEAVGVPLRTAALLVTEELRTRRRSP